jgi:glutaconyl-CoA/methylmalonyl-CoA decarboxylase subunit delta
MENLGFGLQITALGMGLVFALLSVLWGVLSILVWLDRPPAPTHAPATQPITLAATTSGADAEVQAAITLAVLAHIAVLRGQAAPLMRSAWPGSQLYASRWVADGRGRQNRSWRR